MGCVSTERQLRNGTYKYQYYVAEPKIKEYYDSTKESIAEEHFLIRYANGKLRHETVTYIMGISYIGEFVRKRQALIKHKGSAIWTSEEQLAYLTKKGVLHED